MTRWTPSAPTQLPRRPHPTAHSATCGAPFLVFSFTSTPPFYTLLYHTTYATMNNGRKKYNVLYTTTSDHPSSVFHFPSQEVGLRWLTQVNEIKRHILDIKDKLAEENREANGTYDDYRPWIIRCQVFIRTFGKIAVPADICHSINSVERGCGIEVTTWPPVDTSY